VTVAEAVFYDNDGVPITGEALDGILEAISEPWCDSCDNAQQDCTCGPVEVAARALYDTPTPKPHELAELHAALEAVCAAGWRIVRTSTCACGQPDHDHGPDDVTYPTDERIVDEWKPEGGDRG